MKNFENIISSMKDIINTKDYKERKEKIKDVQLEILEDINEINKDFEEKKNKFKEKIDADIKNATGHGFNVRKYFDKKSDE